MKEILESYTGKTLENKKSKTAARLDFFQSATGLTLLLFMVVHTFLVSSILISKDFMHQITIFFEGQYFFDEPHPEIVTGLGVVILLIIMFHAWIAVRKFPQNSQQYKQFKAQMAMMKHKDTNMWFWQFTTGFFIFFFVVAHIFVVAGFPETIGPNGSSDRVYSGYWFIYGILLLLVEVHMMAGFYKLCLKWGWFDGSNPKRTRSILRGLYYMGEIFLLVIGIATLVAYYNIGKDLEANGMKGQKYVPTTEIIEKK